VHRASSVNSGFRGDVNQKGQPGDQKAVPSQRIGLSSRANLPHDAKVTADDASGSSGHSA
jgi:hypothetical protein